MHEASTGMRRDTGNSVFQEIRALRACPTSSWVLPAHCLHRRRHPTPSIPSAGPAYVAPQLSSTRGRREARNFRSVQRQMQQLDHLTAQQGWPRSYDFIKMDVQGAEKLVLQGGQHTLRRTDAVVMELAVTQYNRNAPLSESSAS